MEDELNIFENGRRPQYFFNGRRPNFFSNGTRPQRQREVRAGKNEISLISIGMSEVRATSEVRGQVQGDQK